MKHTLVFLQNAWSPVYAGMLWPRDSWLRALHRSRTGRRLSLLERNVWGHVFHYDNTTDVVGVSPTSIIPADLFYMRHIIETIYPDVLIACGRQAATAVLALQYVHLPTLLLPHPAWRPLTNGLLLEAAWLLSRGFTGCQELTLQR